MSEPLRDRLAALIAEWRKLREHLFAENETEEMARRHLYGQRYMLGRCVDELAALLAAPEPEPAAPRCAEHGVELICPICCKVTIVARAAAPEGKANG